MKKSLSNTAGYDNMVKLTKNTSADSDGGAKGPGGSIRRRRK